MPQFRHHNTGQVHSTSSEDETATYDDDALWQRIEDDDDDVEPESEPTADEIAATLEELGRDRRNLIRDALAQFDDDTIELPTADLFDPSAHSVAEVQEYLKSLDPDALAERQRVIEAEKAGQGRKGVLALPPATAN